MSVKAILSRKGRDVVTVAPTDLLGDLVRTLNEHKIGAAVVQDETGRVVGMLSERDVVRALAQHGPAVLERSIDQVMTRDVKTCGEADTIRELAQRMTSGRFRHLPVVEDGRLVGLVSIGDVVKQRLDEMEAESSALRDYILTA